MSEKFRCMKCKKNVKADPNCHIVYSTKNGKKFALKAECKECGTNLTRFCSEEDASYLEKKRKELQFALNIEQPPNRFKKSKKKYAQKSKTKKKKSKKINKTSKRKTPRTIKPVI